MPNSIEMKNIINLKDFSESILKGTGIRIIKFYADWNGSSQIMRPIYLELSEQYMDRADFFDLDVDRIPEIIKMIGIFELPTISVYVNGIVNQHFVGLKSKMGLIEKIQPILFN